MSDSDNRATFHHDGSNYEVSLETILPQVAQSYLAHNDRNRKFSESQIAKIRDAINENDWTLNGATVVFDSDGNLSDGQHRLLACVRTGKSFVTFVVRGVTPLLAQDTTDNTRKRTLSSQLQIRGEANYKSLASTIATYWQMRHDAQPGTSSGSYPSITQGLRLLDEHPGLRESTRLGNRTKDRPLRYTAGLAGGLHYAFSQVDPEDAEAFWDRFIDGHNLAEGNPIFTLRERMLADAARPDGKQQMAPRYRAAITIKSWNAWRAGESLKLLKWRPGGANPEPFPSINGIEVPA